jgi:dolichol-phosphate mannosyltransferase
MVLTGGAQGRRRLGDYQGTMRTADLSQQPRPSEHPGPRRRVTYVLPVYDEADGVLAFHTALVAATSARPDLDFAFVYVDDGSRDGSLDRLLELRRADSRVRVLGLSRNFGHQIAVTAGLDAAKDADAVIVMDTDLQDPPRVSLEMIAMWEGGVDVVYAQRRSRRDTLFKRSTAYAFYWVLDRLASIEIPRNVGDFRLMDRRVVAEVGRYREHDRFLRGIVAHVGFRQEALLFDRDPRFAGSSGYPLRTMLRFAASGILGFSTAPLRMISRAGVLISGLSVLMAAYVLWVRLVSPQDAVPGWAFLGVGMFLLSGLQLIMMGVIGSYLGRVYVEAQDRPLYSVALAAGGEHASVTTLRGPLSGRR